jgi:hypothetical protein
MTDITSAASASYSNGAGATATIGPVNGSSAADGPEPKATGFESTFYALVWSLYEMYKATNATLKYHTLNISDLSKSVEKAADVQIMSTELRPAKDADPKNNFPLGGAGNTAENLAKANDFMDRLHALGIAMDTPPGYASNHALKLSNDTRQIKPDTFQGWIDKLNGLAQKYRDESGTETAQADNVQKHASAMMDLSTAVLKAYNTSIGNVTVNFNMR